MRKLSLVISVQVTRILVDPVATALTFGGIFFGAEIQSNKSFQFWDTQSFFSVSSPVPCDRHAWAQSYEIFQRATVFELRLLGTLSKDDGDGDGDGNENGKKAIDLDW